MVRYKTLSDKYASEIRITIKKIKNKHDRQSAFKEITHRLEAFGIKCKI